VQIISFNMLFSLDSVITAVGVADELWVMVAAIVTAMSLMLLASGPLAGFIDRNPSVRIFALSFLLLIGMMLVADGSAFIYRALGPSAAKTSYEAELSRRTDIAKVPAIREWPKPGTQTGCAQCGSPTRLIQASFLIVAEMKRGRLHLPVAEITITSRSEVPSLIWL
jgi:hypothetical protein